MTFSVVQLPPELADHMKATGTWKDTGPVPLERLSLVRVSYFDFEGSEHHDGEIVVLDAAAHYALAAFRVLHARRFPIARMKSVHHYNADDIASMADNNTSCFCDRPIEGTDMTSLHSYGLAIDLNPLQNPFIFFDEDAGTAKIYPSKGWEYVNRHNQKSGMIEDVVSTFAEQGFFIWGGRWTTPIDFHHVQPPRGVAEILMLMPPDEGRQFFQVCATYRAQLSKMPFGERIEPIKQAYRDSSSLAVFIDRFIEYLPQLS
jgi:hypothetical protein